MEWFADSLFYMIGGIANPLLFSNSMLAGYKVLATAVQEPSRLMLLYWHAFRNKDSSTAQLHVRKFAGE